MENKCYIVTFEVDSSTRLSQLIAAIKNYGTWAKITHNTWAVVTNTTALNVRNNLQQYISTTDRLFVVKSGFEAAWINTHCENDWLKGNL